MRGVSFEEKIAEELLKKHKGEFISRRDGHVIVKLRENSKTAIMWIRQSPLTEEALELFRRIVKKYNYDRLILMKLYGIADYVGYNELEIFDEIRMGGVGDGS